MKKVNHKKINRHSMLFDKNLPFQGRYEKSKVSYCRKSKHKAQSYD